MNGGAAKKSASISVKRLLVLRDAWKPRPSVCGHGESLALAANEASSRLHEPNHSTEIAFVRPVLRARESSSKLASMLCLLVLPACTPRLSTTRCFSTPYPAWGPAHPEQGMCPGEAHTSRGEQPTCMPCDLYVLQRSRPLQPRQPAPADPHLPTRPAHPPLTASPVDTPLPTSPADSHRVASACRCASTTSSPPLLPTL